MHVGGWVLAVVAIQTMWPLLVTSVSQESLSSNLGSRWNLWPSSLVQSMWRIKLISNRGLFRGICPCSLSSLGFWFGYSSYRRWLVSSGCSCRASNLWLGVGFGHRFGILVLLLNLPWQVLSLCLWLGDPCNWGWLMTFSDCSWSNHRALLLVQTMLLGRFWSSGWKRSTN